MWRASRRFGIDDAEIDDVVQRVFWVAYRRFADFRPSAYAKSSVKSWLLAILRHVVRDHRRTIRRKSPHTVLPHTDPETLADARHPGPHEALAKIEAARLVHALLDVLDSKKRDVFVLAEIEELREAEIAEALGLTAGAVSSRLRAARRDFRRAAERHQRRDLRRV